MLKHLRENKCPNPELANQILTTIETSQPNSLLELRKEIDCSKPTFYRILNWLKEAKYIDEDLKICPLENVSPVGKEKAPAKINGKQFRLPGSILNGKLPTSEYVAAHLASQLALIKNHETLPGWDLTREQICQIIRNKLNADPLKTNKMVSELINNLALYALYLNDLEAFTNMSSRINYVSPEDLERI